MSRFAERSHKGKIIKKTQYNSSYCELGPPVIDLGIKANWKGGQRGDDNKKELICFHL